MTRLALTFVASTLVGWFVLSGSMSTVGQNAAGWAIGLPIMIVAQTAIWAASDFLFGE
jgi:hypothetical protein